MPTANSPSPRVLVLDPSDESRLVLCELLGRAGVAVAPASGVETAIEAIRKGLPMVVFVDADGFSAVEVASIVETCGRRGAATVVAGTNRVAGNVAFVRKPYHYRELVHKIGAALEATGSPGRAAA